MAAPACTPGIGKLITNADSADLISGVKAKAYPLWPDDRGYFLEVIRMKQGLAQEFPVETTQVSAALSYPGTIKAFHFHRRQTTQTTTRLLETRMQLSSPSFSKSGSGSDTVVASTRRTS